MLICAIEILNIIIIIVIIIIKKTVGFFLKTDEPWH